MPDQRTWVEIVLVPALVAAAVAFASNLISEFALKPYASARTDRLLRGRRLVPDFLTARDALDARLWPLFRLGQPWEARRSALEVAEATAAADRALEALAAARSQIRTHVAASTRPVLLDLKALLVDLGASFSDGSWTARTDERTALGQYAEFVLETTKYYDVPFWHWRERAAALAYAEDRMAP